MPPRPLSPNSVKSDQIYQQLVKLQESGKPVDDKVDKAHMDYIDSKYKLYRIATECESIDYRLQALAQHMEVLKTLG